MKRICSVVLCICMLYLLAVPANAATGNARLLEYDHIGTITANLTIDRFWGIASCDGSVDASGDYPVYITVYLQQKVDDVWQTLTSWSNEGQIATSAGGRYAIAKGYQYRTYTTGFVYDDDGNIIDSAYASYGVTYE